MRDLELGRVPPDTGAAINLAGPTLLHRGSLEQVNGLSRFLPSYRIILELTDTALITQLELVGGQFRELRNRGFLIALEDFGGGYSSLRYPANMTIDLVKFDISMVRSLDADAQQRGLFEDLSRLIIKAEYKLVAEGIEGDSTREKAAALGFLCGQGHLFGQPQPEPGCRPAAAPIYNSATVTGRILKDDAACAP